MKNKRFKSLAGRLFAGLALGALAVLPLRATDVAYVTTYTGSVLTVCDPYCANPLALTPTAGYSPYGSGTVANPPGAPSHTRCTYFYDPGTPNWSIKPTLAVAGGVYRIEIAHNITSSCTPDVLITAFSNDGTVSSSCTNTIEFQRARGGDVWRTIGYITNNPGVTQPIVLFYYISGTINNTGTGRLYVDCFKFTEINLCDGVVGDLTITGPLAANQTVVHVTGVTAGATNVTVYANDVEIGQTNYAAGFAAGALDVTTSALVKDNIIKATQSKINGVGGVCTSSMPSSGPPVGGGANPQVKVSLACGAQSALAGPAGADTSGAATVQYFVKCTGLVLGSASAPVGGAVLTPGSCWQTVTFDFTADPKRAWMGNTDYAVVDPFCLMEGLAFAIDTDVSADSGPYDIYVDLIKNGDVVIENFEGWTSGSGVSFNSPNVASFPSPGATYLGAPNSALVSQVNAYEGTNSCRIKWQFATTDAVRWARVLMSRSNGATYPQLDTSKPVTVRFLVLSVGETTNKLSVSSVASHTNAPGSSVTFSAIAKGEAPFTYQWKKNGVDINLATGTSYNIPIVAAGDAGTYTVAVDNAACEPVESSPAKLTVQSLASAVTISNIVNNLDGTLTINYGGGAGTEFILVQSTDLKLTRDSWTPVKTNTATPGSFTFAPGIGITWDYAIRSK